MTTIIEQRGNSAQVRLAHNLHAVIEVMPDGVSQSTLARLAGEPYPNARGRNEFWSEQQVDKVLERMRREELVELRDGRWICVKRPDS